MTRLSGACPACGEDGTDGEYGLLCSTDGCRVVFYEPERTESEIPRIGCPHCIETFDSDADRRRHIEAVHGEVGDADEVDE